MWIRESDKKKPQLSVVIPAYNEAALLPLCLQSLVEQDYMQSFEVIVVDNASTDNTAKLAKAYGVRVVREPKRGIVYARKAGFEAARGNIIVSTDADTVVPTNWLSTIAKVLEDHKYYGVIGGIELTQANNIRKKFIRLLSPIYMLINAVIGGEFSGTNFAVRAKTYHAVGGFDTSYAIAEDIDLSRRIKQAGYKLKRQLRLRVKTSSRRFGTKLSKQLADYWSGIMHRLILRSPSNKVLDPVREKAFDVNRRVIKHPVLVILGIIIIATGIWVLFNPRVNIYSQARANTTKRQIALTFDDGPNEPYTSQILDILQSEHIKATFFVVGSNVRRHPDVANQIVADGNLIANHSDNHKIQLMLGTPSQIVRNVNAAETSIEQTTGKRPYFYRPSYGFRTPWGARAVRNSGYFVVTWDDMTYDYWGLAPDKIVHDIVRDARPGGIIVLHDGREANESGNRGNVVAALPIIIQQLKSQGYEFVTLDQLFGTKAYK